MVATQIFFGMFIPIIGEDEAILTNIFQTGWFNHQLLKFTTFSCYASFSLVSSTCDSVTKPGCLGHRSTGFVKNYVPWFFLGVILKLPMRGKSWQQHEKTLPSQNALEKRCSKKGSCCQFEGSVPKRSTKIHPINFDIDAKNGHI